MNWLQNILKDKAAPVPATPKPCIPAPEPPAWTDEDTIKFRQFLQSETGQRFVSKSRAMEYDRAVTLPRDPFNPAHNCGIITGISDTIRWMLSLSDIRFSQASGDSDATITADAHQDEDALLKQFSP